MNQQHDVFPCRIAVLLTDMKGSSAFYRNYGNLAGRVMIQKHNALLFPIIQNASGVIVNTLGDSIISYFDDPHAALNAAIGIQRKLAAYNKESKEHERLFIRTAIHYGDCIIEEKNIFGYAIETAAALLRLCDAYEILITGDFYETIRSRNDIVCTPRTLSGMPEALSSETVYCIDWSLQKSPPLEAEDAGEGSSSTLPDSVQHILNFSNPIIPTSHCETRDIICFYCGMTAHDAAHCPSKLIQKPTVFLDRLAYVPLNTIRDIYNDFLHDYLKPLEPAENEQRYTILFEQDQVTRFSLGFFSLYEISRIFQIYFVYGLFTSDNNTEASPYRSNGSLLIGRDCLRVTRGNDADEWFARAIRENPKDYRPYVDMGLTAIERMDPSQAIACFKRALSAADGEHIHRHITLLTARAYEVAGALSRACEDMGKIIDPAHLWHDGLYYYAVLLSKLGKRADAVSLLQKLVEHSHRYFLMILLDPSLSDVRDSIAPFIQHKYSQVYTTASQSMHLIEETFAEIRQFFTENDSEYQNAHRLYKQAKVLFHELSFGGLCDIPGIEFEINRLHMHAVERRRSYAENVVLRNGSFLRTISFYISRYPYRHAISKHDLQLLDHFKALYEQAQKAVNTISLERLQLAQELLTKLTAAAQRLVSVQNRLELQKNIYFIMEFTYKLAVAFFGTGIVTGLFFVFVLSAYQAISQTVSGFGFDTIIRYCQYGLIVGFFSGIVGAGVWFKRRFKKMFAKLGE